MSVGGPGLYVMAAARAEYVRRKGLRRAEFALSHNRYLSLLGSVFSPVSNAFLRLPPFQWAMEKTIGLDRRRAMPTFQRGSFVAAAQRRLAEIGPPGAPVEKVVYFVDSYANSNDHELGSAVLDVLRHNGVEVIVPRQRPAPLPAIVYGDVKTARRDLTYNVRYLGAAARQGCKIVCSEPSAALCLQHEMRHYVSGDDARLVSESTWELMNYLADLRRRGKLKAPTESVRGQYVYHLPCHLCAVGDETVTLRCCASTLAWMSAIWAPAAVACPVPSACKRRITIWPRRFLRVSEVPSVRRRRATC